jgi:hypothetical protein
MKHFRLKVIYLIPGIVLLVTIYILMTVKYIGSPGTVKEADFKIFFTAGRLADTGAIKQLYNIQAQLGVQEALIGHSLDQNELLPFNHPPLLVPILQIITTPDYLASYLRWLVILICLLGVSGYVIVRALREKKVGRVYSLLILAALFLFYPVFISLLKGQDTPFLLLGGVLLLYGILTQNDPVAGLGLAMLIIRPQIALILSVPFLFNRRKVWWWFCGGAAVLTLYSLVLVGFGAAGDFIHLLLISAVGQGYGLTQGAMFNFNGMMLRIFPQININLVHGLAWGLFVLSIAGLSILWKTSGQIGMKHLVLAICLSLFAAPHLHYHDLAILMISLLGLVLIIIPFGKQTILTYISFIILASIILLLGEWWDPLRFSFPYLIMAVVPLIAWKMEKQVEAI